MTNRVPDDTPRTGDITDTFQIEGNIFRLHAHVPPESGIDNTLDAYDAGFPVDVTPEDHADLTEVERRLKNVNDPCRIKGGYHRTRLYRVLFGPRRGRYC